VSSQDEAEGSDLIERVLSGDRSALEEFLLRHYDWLEAYVRRRIPLNQQGLIQPEDVIQEVYLRVFQAADRYRPQGRGQLYAWLQTIARNVLTDTFRKRKPGGAKIDVDSDRQIFENDELRNLLEGLAVDQNPSASQHARLKELHQAFLVALGNLPGEYRQVIELLYLQQQPIEAVAEKLGKSVDAVRGLRMRARRQLRDAIDRLSRFI